MLVETMEMKIEIVINEKEWSEPFSWDEIYGCMLDAGNDCIFIALLD